MRSHFSQKKIQTKTTLTEKEEIIFNETQMTETSNEYFLNIVPSLYYNKDFSPNQNI